MIYHIKTRKIKPHTDSEKLLKERSPDTMKYKSSKKKARNEILLNILLKYISFKENMDFRLSTFDFTDFMDFMDFMDFTVDRMPLPILRKP